VNASELLAVQLKRAKENLAFYTTSSEVLNQHTLAFRSALNNMQWESFSARYYRERAYAFIEKAIRLQSEYSRVIFSLRQYVGSLNSARLKAKG
jgi:hypothetical protein